MKTLPFNKRNKKSKIGAIIRPGARETTGTRTNTSSSDDAPLSDLSYLITDAPVQPSNNNNNLLLIGGAALLLYFILK